MKFKNSVAIVRTKKDNVVGSHMIFTYGYREENPNQFAYDGYRCKLVWIGGNCWRSCNCKNRRNVSALEGENHQRNYF